MIKHATPDYPFSKRGFASLSDVYEYGLHSLITLITTGGRFCSPVQYVFTAAKEDSISLEFLAGGVENKSVFFSKEQRTQPQLCGAPPLVGPHPFAIVEQSRRQQLLLF